MAYSWFLGPALCGGYWPLVGEAGSEVGRITVYSRTLSRASAGSLVGRIRVQKIPRLLPPTEISTRLLAGRAGSWNPGAGIRGSRAGVRALVRKSVPDTPGYRVQGVWKLALVC